MKYFTLVSLLFLFSINSYAETCKGIISCGQLYSKLTGSKLKYDKKITIDMTLAIEEIDLTKENAAKEFPRFLNLNGVYQQKSNLIAIRNGEFLKAPIYHVTKDNVPQMINKDGLVTFSYEGIKKVKDLLTADVQKHLTYRKGKSHSLLHKQPAANIIIVCETYENAEKMMRQILQNDSEGMNEPEVKPEAKGEMEPASKAVEEVI